MNENARKWVAALRSGEFQQTKWALHTEEGFCCLGVGCEVYQREVGGLKVEKEKWWWTYDGVVAGLPEPVFKWLGLRGFRRSEQRLTSMNDNEGRSFAQIADFIESEPEGLFA